MRERGVERHAHALHPAAAARGAHVIGEPFRVQQHVAVEQHDVIAPGRREGEVAQARHSKALMYLPQVTGGVVGLGGVGGNHGGGRWTGAVIRDQQLVG